LFYIKEENSMNFEAYSTSLHVKMDVLITYRTINNNEDIQIINGSYFIIIYLDHNLKINIFIPRTLI
jgi:hypothetical protein